MRKIILTLFVLAATLVVSESQAKGLVPIKVGVKAGLNLVDLKVDNVSSEDFYTDVKNGYHIGIMSRITLGPVYVQPELMYNRNTITYVANDNGSLDSEKLKLSTVDVPVMVGMNFLGVMRVGLGANFTVYDNKDGDLLNSNSAFSKEATTSFLVGLGVSVLGIELDARYVRNFGSTDQEIVLSDKTINAEIARSAYQISLGYMF